MSYGIDIEAAKHKPISQLTMEERWAIWESEQEAKKIARNGRGEYVSWADPRTPANAETATKIRIDVALSRIVAAQSILETEYPEPKWAVKGLIPQGVTFIAGPPKLGKSIFALNIAIAVAEGSKALSYFDVEQGSVLYLALEDGPRRIQERLRKLTNGRISGRLEIVNEWPRLDQGGLEAIDAWIERRKDARLLIVDTLKMLRPSFNGRDRNAYDLDYEAIQPLTKLVSQRVSLKMVHHTRKAMAEDPLATVSGSYGLTGAADGVLILSRRRNRSDALLSVIGRDVEEQELALEFKPDMCLWSVLGKADEVRRSSERQEILDLLCQTRELMTPSNIAELLDKPPGAIRFLLFKMKNAEEIALFGNKYQLPNFAPSNPVNIRNQTKIRSVSALALTDLTANAPMFNNDNDLQENVSALAHVHNEPLTPEPNIVSVCANALTDAMQSLQAKDIGALAVENNAANAANAESLSEVRVDGYFDPILEAVDR